MLWFLILAAGQIAGTHLRCSVFNAVYSPESNYHIVVKSYFSHFRECSSFFLVVINLALGNGKKINYCKFEASAQRYGMQLL